MLIEEGYEDNVIIAAGSTVCKSLPANTVCAGSPAKVVKSLDAYYRNFIVLYMPRTSENMRKYVLNRHRVGGSAAEYAEILQRTEQQYPDYRAFLEDALGEDVVSGSRK